MRAIKFISIFALGLFLSNTSYAQVTAVMQASVKVISGSALTAPSQSQIALNSSTSEFNALNFSLTAAPYTDVEISVDQNTALKNEFGEVIDLKDVLVKRDEENDGSYSISVHGKVENGQPLKGKYQGTFTAVVEYL